MRRLSFSTRFALILTLLGGLIAGATVAIPLAQASRERDQSALDRVADRSNTALALLAAEQRSLSAFATSAASQVSVDGDIQQQLASFAAAADPADVVGYIDGPTVVVAGATNASTSAWLEGAPSHQDGLVADTSGNPWIA